VKTKRSMKAVSESLNALLGKPLGRHELEEFVKLVGEFHALDDPEKEKLKQKDKDFVNFLRNRFARDVLRAFQRGNITITEQNLFLMVAVLFIQVESILWELKGYAKEPIPKPDPLPPDDEDPEDDDRPRRI
jgi:hypothetical protein